MSTTALHIIELVKSLPDEEQRAICAALTGPRATVPHLKRRKLQRLPDGTYFNPNGIPNDDPFFKILEEDEAARRRDFGPAAPAFE